MFMRPFLLHARLSADIVVLTYSAAPSQAQLTILNDHTEAIVRAAWGFVPEWADGRPDVKPIINARAETVATKPFFRDAFKKKRCLVLADGFYEWKRAGKSKVPYRIALKTEEPFAFAGIWSMVHDAQGEMHPIFALLTTEANTLVSQIHNRMPVILREQDEKDWLNPSLALDATQALLVPLPADLLMMYEVSSKVNSSTYNSPDLLQPVTLVQE
jgi:putative SOS response-associated peptidase YedK